MLFIVICSLAATYVPPTHGCLGPVNVTDLPFCDTSLDFTTRARDLTSRLTLGEKICLSQTPACAVPRLGLPAYNWGVEDLHGAGTQCLVDNATGTAHCPTIFPTLAVLGASFNDTAWQSVGAVIGREMRAANNMGGTRYRHPSQNPPVGVNGWGPNINIARDPRWGRNSEVPSEDPFLSGKVGAAMTRGIQRGSSADDDSKYVLLLGALKHVTAYSLENWVDDTGGVRNGTRYNRMGFEGRINRHDLAETYLEQFRIGIVEGEALGMMCSYAAINGTASCENGHLLGTWARASLGFEGNVVSDCGALTMPSEPQDKAQSAAAALNAGTDLNCGNVYTANLAEAIAANATTEEALDATTNRNFALLMRAGYFDPPAMVPHTSLGPHDVGTPASHALARDAALQGMVLLRNARGALPLRPHARTAVVGPLANVTLGLASRYYDAICPGALNGSRPWAHGQRPSACIESPLQRIVARGGQNVTHASGWTCAHDHPGDHCVQSTDQGAFGIAADAVKWAEQVVVFVGSDNSVESEGRDRQSLGLPGAQAELLAAVRSAAAPSTRIVVVLLHGGAVAMDYAGVADAVVDAFRPGIEGAEAIACALYGETGCNRWGRLPVQILPHSFARNDMADMGISTGGSGSRGYRYYDGTFGAPLFDFGWGLSYVQFRTAASARPRMPMLVSPTRNVSFSVTTTNTGKREGDQVLLLYHCPRVHRSTLAAPVGADTPLPRRRLVGFRRVGFVAAGASEQVTFTIDAESVAIVDELGNTQLVSGKHALVVSQGDGIDDVAFDVEVKESATLRELHW